MNFIKSLFNSKSLNQYEYKNIDEPSKADLWRDFAWLKDENHPSLLIFKKEKLEALSLLQLEVIDISYNSSDDDKASALYFAIKKYRSLAELYRVDSPKLDFAMECEDIDYKIYLLLRTLTGLIHLLAVKKSKRRTVGVQVTMAKINL